MDFEDKSIVITHRGVLGAFVCGALGYDYNKIKYIELPYACVLKVNIIDDKLFLYPSEDEVENIYKDCETPTHIIAHCKKVAEVAVDYGKKLNAKGLNLNLGLINASASLHDILRLKPRHAIEGGNYLYNLGYKFVGDIVSTHEALGHSIKPIDESALVYYIDKIVQETNIVTVEERFSNSAWRCESAEAMEKHRLLYEESKNIEKVIEKILNS